jgi:hypothetical protein
MRLDPTSHKIGRDTVTSFSMVSGPEDETFERLVGQIAVEFGRLEYLVKVAAEKLNRELALRGGIEEGEISFIDGMVQAERVHSFSKYCALLGTLHEKWESDSSRVLAFKELVKHLLNIGEERNAVMHGCWSTSSSETFLRLRSRFDRQTKTLHQSVERYTLFDLSDFYRNVNSSRFLVSASIGMDLGPTVPIAAPVPPIKTHRSTELISRLRSVANLFNLSDDTLAGAIGISPTDMQAVERGEQAIDVHGAQYGRADVLCVWLRKLQLQSQGNNLNASKWLSTIHPRLGTTPIQAIGSIEGLITVIDINLPDE